MDSGSSVTTPWCMCVFRKLTLEIMTGWSTVHLGSTNGSKPHGGQTLLAGLCPHPFSTYHFFKHQLNLHLPGTASLPTALRLPVFVAGRNAREFLPPGSSPQPVADGSWGVKIPAPPPQVSSLPSHTVPQESPEDWGSSHPQRQLAWEHTFWLSSPSFFFTSPLPHWCFLGSPTHTPEKVPALKSLLQGLLLVEPKLRYQLLYSGSYLNLHVYLFHWVPSLYMSFVSLSWLFL